MRALRLKTESDSQLLESEVEEEEEVDVASHYFKLVVALVGQHLQSSLTYSHSLPGMLAILLTKNPELRLEKLGALRRLWEWLMEKERQSLEHPQLASFLEELQFTRWTWVREICLELWEENFESLPANTEEALRQCFFGGVMSTNIIEDSFNELKRLGAQSANRKLRRQRRFHGLQCSALQAEYAMPAPPRPLQKPTNTSLPANIFEGAIQSFSLEREFLDEFSSSSWQAPSPAKWALIPMALHACFCLNDWQLLQNCWMTLLLEEGCLLVHSSAPSTGKLVLKVTKYGALTWPLERQVVGKMSYYEPVQQRSGRQVWTFDFVNNLTDWKAGNLVPTPPCEQPVPENGIASGIKLQLVQKCEKLTAFGAERCFKNLLVPHLRSLWQALGRPMHEGSVKQPRTEQEYCHELLCSTMSKSTEEERAVILATRCKPQETTKTSMLFQGENLELIAGVLDESDKVDFEDEKKKHMKTKGSRSSRGAGEGIQPTASKDLVKQKISLKGGHTPDAVKQYLPKNFRIALDENRHKRWQMEDVLKRTTPASFSKSYGDESVISKQTALHLVLEKAWEWHAKHTGEVCPWSFATA
eukprot:6472491-Amphidinium_carterae.4